MYNTDQYVVIQQKWIERCTYILQYVHGHLHREKQKIKIKSDPTWMDWEATYSISCAGWLNKVNCQPSGVIQNKLIPRPVISGLGMQHKVSYNVATSTRPQYPP